jgi:hypothetical protein
VAALEPFSMGRLSKELRSLMRESDSVLIGETSGGPEPGDDFGPVGPTHLLPAFTRAVRTRLANYKMAL